jgi:hypothetical protein
MASMINEKMISGIHRVDRSGCCSPPRPLSRGLGRCIHLLDDGPFACALDKDGTGEGMGRVNPHSGEHDRVAAADGPAADNRGVNADVYCVVLSSRAEDS